jgi:poly(beta-D-mannuronate) lyase
MRVVVTKPGLIPVVLLSLLAACAEVDAGPPGALTAAATPETTRAAAVTAAGVRRPGEVLLADRAARRAVLQSMPESSRQALCGKLPERWPSHPAVKRVEAPDDGGPDERSEPFALTVMAAAAAGFGLDDPAARRALVAQLDRWAREGGLTLLDADTGRSNAYYAINRVLLPTVVAWSLVRDAPEAGAERAVRIDRWLRRVARLRGELRPPGNAGEVTRRNNHRYLSASASMAWGALAGDDAYFREGPAAFDMALADMRPDGSLPLETRRGSRALWYQRHAIASLVTIAEMAAVQGRDLYSRERQGRSLHTAIRFLLDAIDDPGLVRRYAAAGADDEEGGAGPAAQDLSFLALRGHGRHYMAWAEVYVARFPGREESRRLLRLLRETDPDFRPMLDDYSGGSTTCLFATP